MAIITTIDNIYKYFPDNAHFISIINYLKSVFTDDTIDNKRIKNLHIGEFEKYYLIDDIYALEQVFYTKPRNECFFESHRKYIDIQMVINGRELMEFADIAKLNPKNPYDDAKDLTIYHDHDYTAKLYLFSNDVSVFFPEDVHLGLQMLNDKMVVRKTVVKVPVNLWRQSKRKV